MYNLFLTKANSWKMKLSESCQLSAHKAKEINVLIFWVRIHLFQINKLNAKMAIETARNNSVQFTSGKKRYFLHSYIIVLCVTFYHPMKCCWLNMIFSFEGCTRTKLPKGSSKLKVS